MNVFRINRRAGATGRGQACNSAKPKQRKHRTLPALLGWEGHPGQLGTSLGFRLMSGSIAVIMGVMTIHPQGAPSRQSLGREISRSFLRSLEQNGNKTSMNKILQVLFQLYSVP